MPRYPKSIAWFFSADIVNGSGDMPRQSVIVGMLGL